MAQRRSPLRENKSSLAQPRRSSALETGQTLQQFNQSLNTRQAAMMRAQQTRGNQYVLRKMVKINAVQRDDDDDGGGIIDTVDSSGGGGGGDYAASTDGGGGGPEASGGYFDSGAGDYGGYSGGDYADSGAGGGDGSSGAGGPLDQLADMAGGAYGDMSDTVSSLIDGGMGSIPGLGDDSSSLADMATNQMGGQDESMWDKFLGGFGGVLQKLFGPSQEDLDRRYRQAGVRNPKGLPPDIKIIYQQGDMIVAEGPAGREVWNYDPTTESWHRRSK